MPDNQDWQQAIRTRFLSLNVLRLMSTQFIFHCDYINSRMKCFNNELEETAKNFGTFSHEQAFVDKLNMLKQVDLMLTELLLLINEYFKKMLLLTITSDIIVLVVDIYWIYGGFIYGNNPTFLRMLINILLTMKFNRILNIAESSLCPHGKVVAILMVFASCGSLEAEKSKSVGFIHLLTSESPTFVHSKRRYLLQKLHTLHYQFDGDRFFYVNYGTLIGVSLTNLRIFNTMFS